VSGSGGMAAVALCAQGPVGLDIEKVCLEFDYQAILRRFFPPAEYAQLAAMPAGLAASRFYELWTRTEAVAKAEGSGLSGLEDRAGLLRWAQDWKVYNFDISGDIKAAVALKKYS
jgi:4'-phosphopantetheinyl transferase